MNFSQDAAIAHNLKPMTLEVEGKLFIVVAYKKIWVGRSQVQNSALARSFHSGISFKNLPFLWLFVNIISIFV